MLPWVSLPGLAPNLTPLQPYSRYPHLQICQNSRTPGVSCQQMARASLASVCPPAVQALSRLPSSILNRATGSHSTEPRGHLFITVLIKGRHTDNVYCLADWVSGSCLPSHLYKDVTGLGGSSLLTRRSPQPLGAEQTLG